MRRQLARFLIVRFVIVLLLAPACAALRPPVQNGGPVLSSEGVEVTVTRQTCAQIQEPDHTADDLVESTLEIQVRNPSADPIAVHRDAFRLKAPDGVALKAVTWRAGDPLTVNAGQTGTFELRFMTRGSLDCSGEMKLDVDRGLTQRDRPLRMGDVRFVPSRAI